MEGGVKELLRDICNYIGRNGVSSDPLLLALE
jgi:hypothetical protein